VNLPGRLLHKVAQAAYQKWLGCRSVPSGTCFAFSGVCRRRLLDFTIIGASHIAHGLTDFSAWSKAMLSIECSQDIGPFLRVIFANSKDMFERLLKLFECHQ
jgi:hypothetical protein